MAFLKLPKEPKRYRVAGDANTLFDPLSMLPKGGKRLPGEVGTDFYAASKDSPLPGHKSVSCKRCKALVSYDDFLTHGRWCARCLDYIKQKNAPLREALERDIAEMKRAHGIE